MCCVGEACPSCKITEQRFVQRHTGSKANKLAVGSCLHYVSCASYHVCLSHCFSVMSISFGVTLRELWTLTTGLALEQMMFKSTGLRFVSRHDTVVVRTLKNL